MCIPTGYNILLPSAWPPTVQLVPLQRTPGQKKRDKREAINCSPVLRPRCWRNVRPLWNLLSVACAMHTPQQFSGGKLYCDEGGYYVIPYILQVFIFLLGLFRCALETLVWNIPMQLSKLLCQRLLKRFRLFASYSHGVQF